MLPYFNLLVNNNITSKGTMQPAPPSSPLGILWEIFNF